MMIHEQGAHSALTVAGVAPKRYICLSDKLLKMAEIYLDPSVIAFAVAIIVATIGFFDFLSIGKKMNIDSKLSE